MGGFRPLKRGQSKKITLHTKGPRSAAKAQAFRKALLRLLEKYQTSVVGYLESVPAPKAKAKSKPKAKRKKRRG